MKLFIVTYTSSSYNKIYFLHIKSVNNQNLTLGYSPNFISKKVCNLNILLTIKRWF